ncbi:MAG: trypsin-like serine protease [Myxococcota bacterium]
MAWHRAMGLLLGMVLTACGGPVDDDNVEVTATLDDDTEDEAALQGGRTTRAYRAVGLLMAESGSFCTGTLIRHDVVLTAAHCVDEPLDAFYIGHGRALTDAERATQGPGRALENMRAYAVVEQVMHPDYEPMACGTTPDLALVRLLEPVGDVNPMAIASSEAAYPGRVCRAVGFGAHGKGSSKTSLRKRSGKEVIVDVTETAVDVRAEDALADHGDSGGPLLCGRRIAGVTSCGPDGSWRTRSVSYARPDMESAWMTEVLSSWEPE